MQAATIQAEKKIAEYNSTSLLRVSELQDLRQSIIIFVRVT